VALLAPRSQQMQLGTPTHKARSFATIGERTMTEYNDTERESKVKQDLVKQQLDRLEADIAQLKVKTQQEFYDELRNGVIEEVVQHIAKMSGFGHCSFDSLAVYIREMKK
jgi:hypothetical protein